MARILVVEDDLNTLSGLVEILKEIGYDVTGVDTGQKALKLLEHEQFNVLLTDYKLPDINGLELCDQSLPFSVGMKTIIMTIASEAPHRKRAGYQN